MNDFFILNELAEKNNTVSTNCCNVMMTLKQTCDRVLIYVFGIFNDLMYRVLHYMRRNTITVD